MTNRCYLCYRGCHTRQCPSCPLKAHRKCWDLLKAQGYCPSCGGRIGERLHNMRSTSVRIKRVCRTIKEYLTAVKDANTRQDKEKPCKELFIYLLENKWFLQEHPVFYEAARKKLRQLVERDGWYEGIPLYEKI